MWCTRLEGGDVANVITEKGKVCVFHSRMT